jgi:hypothetical protein
MFNEGWNMAGQPRHAVVVYGRAAASPSLKFGLEIFWSSLQVNYSKLILNNFVVFQVHKKNMIIMFSICAKNKRTFDHEALVRHSLSTILRKILSILT